MKQLILLIFIASFVSCDGQRISKKDVERTIKEQEYPNECSNFYLFDGDFIDLRTLKQLDAIDIPPMDFKYCSKYAHRFSDPFSDSAVIGEFTVVVNKKKAAKIYQLDLYKNGAFSKSIPLPVESPLPEVHEYNIHIFPYKNDVIMFMEDMYTTHYIICKYNLSGKEMMRKEIEHTHITHPDPKTNHHHRYLHFSERTASQMIFTSHMAFADKFKTVLLNLDDFTEKEYPKMAHGYILDDKDEEVIGFVSSSKDYEAEKQPVGFHITMINGTEYDFSIDYGDNACEFLMKDSLLYIANYHPIATGCSLHCFDMRTGKMKWTADVLQVNASHSEYWNDVTLSLYKNKLVMQGDEAYGSYLQIFDVESGKRLAHFGNVMEEKK